LVASQIGFGVKLANFGCVSSIAKMSSLTTMQVAVSSVNCGLKVNPSRVKNSMLFGSSDRQIDEDLSGHFLPSGSRPGLGRGSVAFPSVAADRIAAAAASRSGQAAASTATTRPLCNLVARRCVGSTRRESKLCAPGSRRRFRPRSQ
jgi:hypothetical protein